MSAEAFLDPRFVALPPLLLSATKPHSTAGEIRRFSDDLLRADPSLFCGCLLFRSRGGRGFVLVHESGGPIEDGRSWLRWPLSRLFATRRSCIITNPRDGRRALAVPFIVSGELYVALAPLSAAEPDEAQSLFLAALQSTTAALPEISAAHAAPRFVWFGRDESLAARLAEVAGRRGWQLLTASAFGQVLILLEGDAADVVLLDASELSDPMYSLRTLRHAAKISDAPIVYFSDAEPGPELRTLVDQCVRPSVGNGELLKALKQSASLIFRTRKQALQQAVRTVEDELWACADYEELAHACAQAATALGGDLASVMLVDEIGSISAAHAPPYQHTLQDRWPTTFVSGETLTHTTVSARFFEEVFDDAEYAQLVRELRPVSAAALPIRDGTRIVGTLLALSRARPMFEPEFAALGELCLLTGRVYAELRKAAANGSPSDGSHKQRWRRLAVRGARIDVYEGARGTAALRVSASGSTGAIVAVEDEDPRHAAARANAILRELEPALEEDVKSRLRSVLERFDDGVHGILVGIIDTDDRLTYACSHFPVPLHVPASGPVPSIRRALSGEWGSISIQPKSLTLVYCNDFATQIEPAQLVAAVQRDLRAGAANAAQALPDLASSRGSLAFASITMLTYGADSQRSQALL